jgi:hypothetical protein
VTHLVLSKKSLTAAIVKNFLLIIAIFLVLQSCGSVRKSNQLNALVETQAVRIPELTASADTLPSGVNAAQTSEKQLIGGVPVAAKPTVWTTKRGSVRQLRTVRKQLLTLRDSTELYARRRPVDLRVTNRTGLASFWLSIGSFLGFVISSSTAAGAFGLVGVLAAIAALVTGFVSLSEFRRNPDKFKGKGYPIAGISWGGFIVLLFLLVLIVVLAIVASM